jgi:valacyclovir hydrolase
MISNAFQQAEARNSCTGKKAYMPEFIWKNNTIHYEDALLNHLACPVCIAVGSSGGGIIALLMAILRPQIVDAVVADSAVSAWLPGQLADMVNQRHNPIEPTRQFWQMGHGDDWEAVIESDGKMLLTFASQDGDWTKKRLTQITCPVLLAGSLHDEFLPQIGKNVLQMAANISNCQIYLTNAGGHALIWNTPQAFFDTVELFLKQFHQESDEEKGCTYGINQ